MNRQLKMCTNGTLGDVMQEIFKGQEYETDSKSETDAQAWSFAWTKVNQLHFFTDVYYAVFNAEFPSMMISV